MILLYKLYKLYTLKINKSSIIYIILLFLLLHYILKWIVLFRNSDPLYGTDLLVLTDDQTGPEGIENRNQSTNIYEYRDKRPASKTGSTHSLRSSTGSIPDAKVSKSPNGRPKTPPVKRTSSRSTIDSSVPMTQVWFHLYLSQRTSTILLIITRVMNYPKTKSRRYFKNNINGFIICKP